MGRLESHFTSSFGLIAFARSYTPLLPILSSSLSLASHAEIEAVQAVLQAQKPSTNHPTPDDILDHLHELGFPALATVGFLASDEAQDTAEQISHLTSELLSTILSNPR